MVKYGVNYRHETSEPSDKGAWLKILGLYDRDKEKKPNTACTRKVFGTCTPLP